MSSQPNQSLIDGISVLQALASSRESIGGRPLARMLGLDPMRANRLLKTLAAIGLAEQDAQRRYRIGPGIHALAAQSIFGSGLLHALLPVITKTKAPTGLEDAVVAIGVLWRQHVTYLYHNELAQPVERGIGRIGLYPASESSLGLWSLSRLADEVVTELYSTDENKDIPGFDNIDALLATLQETRERGYAAVLVQREGFEPHQSIAMGMGDHYQTAIGISLVPVGYDIKDIQRFCADICAGAEL